MIRFACTCGRELQAPENLIGSEARCPVCNELQVVPREDEIRRTNGEEGPSSAPPRRRPILSGETGESARREVRQRGSANRSLGLALSSFLFGPLTGIPAVIVGFRALREAHLPGGANGERSKAVAAMIIGAIGTLFPVIPALLLSHLLPTVQHHAALRTQSANNLRQMALAMKVYSLDNGGVFPSAAGGKGIHPNLSWRVAILPYIEEEALYAQFHLDEPWDSPHNLQLLPRMPLVYTLPGFKDPPGMTRYRVFVGKDAAFEKPDPDAGPPLGRQQADFPRDTSKTIFVVEAADAVPWTKPDELDYVPGQPLPPLKDGRCQFAMGDASVRSLDPNTSDAELRAMINRNGPEKAAAQK
jgi:hypothetical protein